MESEHGSLLYTGDFKLRPGLSAEPAQWRHAETLIMETTYGLPKYRLPPTEEVIANMVAFCQDALDDGATPVLLGYSLGKAQEILCALIKAGLTPMLHGAVFKMTEVCREMRPDFPTGYVRYEAGGVAGKVLVCPPSANRSIMVRKIKSRRTAVLTGWALDPGATFRYQCDAAFPLSDHADYTDLVRYVELVAPKRVLTLHGFAAAFAADLRQRGFEAWALSQENQLEFDLAGPKIAAPPPRQDTLEHGAGNALVDSEFAAFAQVGEQIAATSSRLKKIDSLAAYFRTLDSAQLPTCRSLFHGPRFCPGRSAHAADGRSGDSARIAIGERHQRAGSARYFSPACGCRENRLRGAARRHFAPALFDCRIRGLFEELQRAKGPLQKTECLGRRLASVTPLEGSYIVRILTGDLRIGLKEGMVADALAKAFDAAPEELRGAHMLLGDMGETALLASQKNLGAATLRLFHPIQCMLASPESTALGAWARLTVGGRAASFWAEDKFDGIRAQVHVLDGRIEIYTRDLRCVSGQFAELDPPRRRAHPLDDPGWGNRGPWTRSEAHLLRSPKAAGPQHGERSVSSKSMMCRSFSKHSIYCRWTARRF